MADKLYAVRYINELYQRGGHYLPHSNLSHLILYNFLEYMLLLNRKFKKAEISELFKILS